MLQSLSVKRASCMSLYCLPVQFDLCPGFQISTDVETHCQLIPRLLIVSLLIQGLDGWLLDAQPLQGTDEEGPDDCPYWGDVGADGGK